MESDEVIAIRNTAIEYAIRILESQGRLLDWALIKKIAEQIENYILNGSN